MIGNIRIDIYSYLCNICFACGAWCKKSTIDDDDDD